jgi:hypothetical protein
MNRTNRLQHASAIGAAWLSPSCVVGVTGTRLSGAPARI